MSCHIPNTQRDIINAVKVGTLISIVASLLVAALYITGNLSQAQELALGTLRYQISMAVIPYALGFIIMRLCK